MIPSDKPNTEQILQLLQEYRETESEEAATELLTHYESMVKMAAAKISRNRADYFEDLFQVGQMTLLRLFKQFDSTLGMPFEAYAMKSLIGQMKNYLRDKSWYIQVPRRVKEKGLLLQNTIDELTIRLERSPRVEEIAEELHLSVEETLEILAGRDVYQYVSLDTPLSAEESGGTIGDMIGNGSEIYENVDARMDLEKAFAVLKDQEKTVLHLVFNEGRSQRDIAEQLGISQMSVSRIQKRAVQKLKHILSGAEPELD